VFLQAEVLEQDTRVGVDVGPRVLGLALFSQDVRDDFVESRDQLEHRVVRQVLQSELTLAGVTRISLSQDGVTVARDDLTTLEQVPDFSSQLLLSGLFNTDLLLEIDQETKNFLVGKTVQRTSKTVHTGSEGQVGVRQSRTDQADSVGRDVTTLVIAVDDQVQAHQVVELSVVEAQQASEVSAVVQLGVVSGDLAVLVGVSVDASSNLGESGENVQGVFEGRVPVLGLLGARLVGLGELRLGLHGSDGSRQLRHGVEVLGEVVQQVNDVLGEIAALVQLVGNTVGLFLSGNLASNHQPQQSLGEGFSTLALGQLLLQLGDGVSTETNTLVGVQQRSLVNHSLNVSHTSVGLFDSAGTQNLGAELGSDFLDFLSLNRNQFLQALLQARLVLVSGIRARGNGAEDRLVRGLNNVRFAQGLNS